ncbi:MAG: response regulator [Pseudomonadota bacterium]
MLEKKYPFGIRLIGFEPRETTQIATLLAQAPDSGPAYSCLSEDSLQDPDLYFVNGDDLKALATVAALNPSAIQPALIIGAAAVDFPAPNIPRPLAPARMFAILNVLIGQRADAMALLTAAGLPSIPERRRRERIDFDLTDPKVYEAQRRARPTGSVLLIDQSSAFRDHVARLMSSRKVLVEWTDTAAEAVQKCQDGNVALVLINATTQGINPYGLCTSIKALPNAMRICVLLLVGQHFIYDSARARASGVRGMLDAPIADRHLVAVLQKILSLPT